MFTLICIVAVPPLFVSVLDLSAPEPSVEPSSLDAGRCRQRLRSRADVEGKKRCREIQERCATRRFVRLQPWSGHRGVDEIVFRQLLV